MRGPALPLPELDTLIPAGTVQLSREDTSELGEASDWLDVLTKESLHHCASGDQRTIKAIAYLVSKRVIRASVLHTKDQIFVRIWLVPVDLPSEVALVRQRNASPNVRRDCLNFLRHVLERTVTSEECWDGRYPSTVLKFFEEVEDNRSLSEIFSQLPSPSVDITKLDAVSREKISSIQDGYVPGLTSILYPYQVRSVSRLIQQERCPGLIPDPTFLPMTTPLCKRMFFINPTTLAVRVEPEMYVQRPGGILAEEMGMGKTIMLLALILSEREGLPEPFASPELDATPQVLSPAAVASFPEFRELRRLDGLPLLINNENVAPLRDMVLHKAACAGLAVSLWEDHVPAHLHALLVNNRPFYHASRHARASSVRLEKASVQQRMFLTTATLVVVPTMLIQQWKSEVLKHTESRALRVLAIEAKSDLPSTEALASKYDIVLMSHHSFSQKWHSSCTCPPISNGASCATPALEHIHWKRLVIDEGNVCASNKTELVSRAAQLKVERKWIASGTPTAGLVGGHVGMTKQDSITPTGQRRKWNARDRDDLNKLGSMIGEFLSIPPFWTMENGISGISKFRAEVIKPLVDSQGPLFGATRILTNVMSRAIVRHRVNDIEKDIELMNYTHEVVLLDLDKYAAKTYNILQTVIAVNAVDSERVGADYLFSPQNVPPLRTLTQNISQTLFWHVDSETFDLDTALGRTREAITKARANGAKADDVNLLEDAYRHQREAAGDLLWRSMMKRDQIPYRIQSLSAALRAHFTAYGQLTAQGVDTPTSCFIDPADIGRLRLAISKCSLDGLSDEDIIQADTALRTEAEVSSEVKTNSKRTKSQGKTGVSYAVAPTRSTFTNALHVKAPPRSIADINRELNSMQTDRPVGPTPGPLGHVRIRHTGSSKLDYILSEVKLYSADEKFIIFSASPMTLVHVVEGLSLIGVRHLQFAFGTSKRLREQLVTTFRTSDSIRVLLMELKDGARGLNIVEASRIIFCEPVWALDVEAQAIKRAHRIGQTRPITVKTLAIRSTVEEETMSKRGYGTSSKDICEDDLMRTFIQNPRFIAHRVIDLDSQGLDLYLTDGVRHPQSRPTPYSTSPSAHQTPPRRRAVGFAEANDDGEVHIDSPSPPRKIRRVVLFSPEPEHEPELVSVVD